VNISVNQLLSICSLIATSTLMGDDLIKKVK